ncbi:nitroreductase family protein [Rhizobium terrae]|uniref:nitroreductase family protein n=1 Tax=Rhizobium terrae TaxID=2171756 RepID=UPI0019676B0A|nr:nitroreductase family protein [Rhizobium terrae]
MLRLSHALEKGMVLPAPRPGFGQDKIKALLGILQETSEKWGVSRVEKISLATIEQLVRYHDAAGLKLPDISAQIDRVKASFPELLIGDEIQAGPLSVSRAGVLATLPSDPDAFFLSRRSVRLFDSREKFDFGCLEHAVRLAQQAPSVCNRQSSKAYIFTKPADIELLLRYQDGNKGFGNTASALVICTSDLSNFYKIGERNQGYIDGGLFAMALVYGFHTLGIGTCMLNWSQAAHTDRKFRNVCRIPPNEVIITMIAVGPLREEYEVAHSPRRDVGEVLVLDDTKLLLSAGPAPKGRS